MNLNFKKPVVTSQSRKRCCGGKTRTDSLMACRLAEPRIYVLLPSPASSSTAGHPLVSPVPGAIIPGVLSVLLHIPFPGAWTSAPPSPALSPDSYPACEAPRKDF